MTTYRSNNTQRHLIFTGSNRYMGPSERAKLLRKILGFRAELAWITPYCYAWFRYEGYLNAFRRELAHLRKPSREQGSQTNKPS